MTWRHRNGLPTDLDQASISARSNGGPMYDDAYLSELKASTPSSRPPLPTPVLDPYNGDVSMDVSMDVSDVSMQSMDVYGICGVNNSLPVMTHSPTDASDISILPEASIRSAKEKRKHLRTIGVDTQDDYISLTVAKQGDESKGPHPESRLMREEDEVGDGDDGEPGITLVDTAMFTSTGIEFAEYTGAQDRIALGKNPRKAEASKRKEAIGEMIVDALVIL
jgi:GC-rich sequence DNA-binding factor